MFNDIRNTFVATALCWFLISFPANAQSLFATIGDYGDGSVDEGSVAGLVYSWSPDFIITLGDNRYGSTDFDETVGHYYCNSLTDAGNGAFCSGGNNLANTFFPSLGNHDYDDGAGLNEYLNYFTLPGIGVPTSDTSSSERYYDFIKGSVHFFVIDSMGALSSATDKTTQMNWLQTQLAASSTPWQVVYFHHAPYSSGRHGSITEMQWSFAAWGADAVISGHDHTYERIFANGIVYFVNGLGGRSIYSFNTPVSGSQVRYNGDYGAMRVDASDISITFEFISTSGSIIDTYTIEAALTDTDGDGVADNVDNCPSHSNPAQKDTDGDGVGDACDSLTDSDGDGIADSVDNCPTTTNPGQQDTDKDGIGDACDPFTDTDDDGVADSVDNCPDIANPDQEDTDANGKGDACDPVIDTDNDGIYNKTDNCLVIPNLNQNDSDNDGFGDACDPPDGSAYLGGTLKSADDDDICAMVLASGQFMFSCSPNGVYSLYGLPSDSNGTVKRQIYADGFFPKVDILSGSSNEAVVMTRSGTCPSYNALYDPAFIPNSAGNRINITGKVLLQDSEIPICAMVLANGQHMFTCDGTGNYALNIPLDTNGQFKLQVYADGFAPITQKFDEFSAANFVRMARASECK